MTLVLNRSERVTAVRDQAKASNPTADRSVVALDDRRQQLAGIRTEPAVVATVSKGLRGLGTVVFDETRFTDINLKLDGWIRTLHVNHTGQRVRRGDPLFTVFSQELIGAQLQYLAALRTREQLTPGQAATREYEERLIETPQRRLLYWDVPEDQLRMMEKAGKPLDAVLFRSPADGVVIKKSATQGMHVQAGETLYTLADTSVVWVEAGFDPIEAADFHEGQHVTVSLDGRSEKLDGKVLLVAPSLSESKTVSVRIEVSNRQGALRPGMFATVDVPAASSHGLVIPEDAVIDSGKRQTVFVSTGDGHFEPRTVLLGLHADDNRVVVLSGLKAGERVVTRATFLLDSESQLRAALDSYGGAPLAPSTTAASAAQASINLWTDPDPAHVGQNALRVRLLDAHQAPVTDASIDVRFYMAAMPSMNMPAMRTASRLKHAGEGIYRGGSTLPMAGPWEVTVAASRDGHPIAEKTVSLLVR